MALPRGRKKRVSKRAEQATVALAVLAVGTAGTVFAGEIARMIRRRRHDKNVPTPDTFGEAAGLAASDTFKVVRKAHDAAPRHETVLFNILTGFLGSFATIRLVTWGIREKRWWPTRNIVIGDTHVHHFVPGIVIGFACGGAALVTEDERLEEMLAVGFGAGAGLTFDEAALLLDLRDVYWSREGLLSIQVSLAVAAMLSAGILAMRMLRRGEEHATEQQLIPGHAEEHGPVRIVPEAA